MKTSFLDYIVAESLFKFMQFISQFLIKLGLERSLLSLGSLEVHDLHCSSSVSEEFWVNSLEGLVSLSLWLLDASSVSF